MFVVFLCDLKQFVNLTGNEMHVPMTMLLFFEKKIIYVYDELSIDSWFDKKHVVCFFDVLMRVLRDAKNQVN